MNCEQTLQFEDFGILCREHLSMLGFFTLLLKAADTNPVYHDEEYEGKEEDQIPKARSRRQKWYIYTISVYI